MAQLLGPDGRPIRKRELARTQGEGGVVGVRKAWPETYASGLTPQRLAGILHDCDQGEIEAFMTLAEEMEERDLHYSSVLGQRKRAISGIPATVKPASEDPKDEMIAAWVRTHIAEHRKMPDLIEQMMDAVAKGFSLVEIFWATDAPHWTPRVFKARPQRFFRFDRETGDELRLLTDDQPTDGEPLAFGKWIYHVASLKTGHVFRGGLARVAAFAWMCKAYTFKDWMAFVELYGLPLRLGRYDVQASREDIEVLFRAVANIGTDAAAVLPKGMDIDFVDMKSGGEKPVFENLARYIDEQISKVVLGQTMTTDDGASQAQAKVHNDVRLDIAQADARQVSGTLNTDLVLPAVLINFGPDVTPPTLVIEVAEPEDVSARVNNIVALSKVGVRFRQSQARALVRMDDPDDEDEVFGGAPVPPAPPTGSARVGTGTARNNDPTDDLDAIEAEMAAEWEPVMDETLQPIIDAIAAAETLEDVLPILDNLDPLPAGRLIDMLVKGGFKARALGDVRDD